MKLLPLIFVMKFIAQNNIFAYNFLFLYKIHEAETNLKRVKASRWVNLDDQGGTHKYYRSRLRFTIKGGLTMVNMLSWKIYAFKKNMLMKKIQKNMNSNDFDYHEKKYRKIQQQYYYEFCIFSLHRFYNC